MVFPLWSIKSQLLDRVAFIQLCGVLRMQRPILQGVRGVPRDFLIVLAFLLGQLGPVLFGLFGFVPGFVELDQGA